MDIKTVANIVSKQQSAYSYTYIHPVSCNNQIIKQCNVRIHHHCKSHSKEVAAITIEGFAGITIDPLWL